MVKACGVFLETLAHPCPHLVETPSALGDADDRHIEVAAFHHRLERRKDLFIGQIACSPEKYKRIRIERVHLPLLTSQVSRGGRRTGIAWPIAACPDNPLRLGS